MTHVHIRRGRKSTSCTFVEGEIHRGDAYIKGEKTFFYEKTLFYLMLVFASCLCVEHAYILMLVQMIICFAMWSL